MNSESLSEAPPCSYNCCPCWSLIITAKYYWSWRYSTAVKHGYLANKYIQNKLLEACCAPGSAKLSFCLPSFQMPSAYFTSWHTPVQWHMTTWGLGQFLVIVSRMGMSWDSSTVLNNTSLQRWSFSRWEFAPQAFYRYLLIPESHRTRKPGCRPSNPTC